MKKKVFSRILLFIVVVTLLSALAMPVLAEEQGKIENPLNNCIVMFSAKADPNAYYGFSPRADQGTLKSYASADWSKENETQVLQWRKEREDYFKQFETMYEKLKQMTEDGADIETIARTISTMRNQIRWDSYKDNPEGLEALKKKNMEQWGHEFGPTPEQLFEKYGNWETVLSKAFSENPAMDACLGLYEERIDYYILLDNYKEHEPVKDEAVEPTETTTGLTEGSHCEVCGTVLVAQEVVPKKDNPKTGDRGYLLWVILAALAATTVGGGIIYSKK